MANETTASGAMVPVPSEAVKARKFGLLNSFFKNALERRIRIFIAFTAAMVLLVFAGCCFSALNPNFARLIVCKPGITFSVLPLLLAQTMSFIFGFTVFGRSVSAAISVFVVAYSGCAVYISASSLQRVIISCASFFYVLSAANSFCYSANAFSGSAKLFNRKLLKEYIVIHGITFSAVLICYFII